LYVNNDDVKQGNIESKNNGTNDKENNEEHEPAFKVGFVDALRKHSDKYENNKDNHKKYVEENDGNNK